MIAEISHLPIPVFLFLCCVFEALYIQKVTPGFSASSDDCVYLYVNKEAQIFFHCLEAVHVNKTCLPLL